MGFFSGLFRGKGPQPALRGESPGFSLVAVGFLSSYDRDLRDPLFGASRTSSLHARCGGASRDSSAVAAGAKVLIWS